MQKLINKKNNNEYGFKINYKFRNPNLKCKFEKTRTNYIGNNDIFEVFLSYKDNTEYIASSPLNSTIDIYILLYNRQLLSLKKHNSNITSIRYFINNKNNDEYLISADVGNIIIIWDITNYYNIKYKINTKYDGKIGCCILIFPININDNYIITSSKSFYHLFNDIENSATKVYSLNNGQFIKQINNSKRYFVNYLLSWYNKNNKNYYLIELAHNKVVINNLLKNELYCVLVKEPETYHNSGFIFKKRNNEYLCTSSINGYIHIWDLYNKNIVKIINTNGCFIMNIINWDDKHIIVTDLDTSTIKIVDIEIGKVISKIKQKAPVAIIKKIYHPIYGESLLIVTLDNAFRLWNI